MSKCKAGNDLNELTEVFMSVAVEDIADGNGPADLEEMWDLLYQDPYPFGANARCSFRGRSCDDAHTFTDVDDSDEGLLEESSDSDPSPAEGGMAVAAKMWSGERSVRVKGLTSSLHKHMRTRFLHMEHVDNSYKTACGRSLGATFVKFLGDPDQAWPHCKLCWGTLDL